MRTDVLDVLSDEALVETVDALVKKERRITFNVVMHLGEIARRGLYLRLGHGSMYDYCTRRLGYSESAAYRRMATYRAIKKCPEIASMVREGRLTITVVGMIAGVLTPGNAADILARVAGKSQRVVSAIVAEYKTGTPVRERIRPIVIERPPVPLVGAPEDNEATKQKTSGPIDESIGGNCSRPDTIAPAHAAPLVQPPKLQSVGAANDTHGRGGHDAGVTHSRGAHRETFYQFTIAADEAFMAMYRRVRAIQSIKARPGRDIATTFKGLMREFIDRHAPEEREKRRAQRRLAAKTRAEEPASSDRPRRKALPAAARDHVLARDNYRCTYVAADGTRCEATSDLQFDHKVPVAKGGDNSEDNLRLLCAKHNRLEAKAAFGARAER